MSSLRTRYYMSLFDEPFVQAHTDLMRDCSIVIGKMTAEDTEDSREQQRTTENNIYELTSREGQKERENSDLYRRPVWSDLYGLN